MEEKRKKLTVKQVDDFVIKCFKDIEAEGVFDKVVSNIEHNRENPPKKWIRIK